MGDRIQDQASEWRPYALVLYDAHADRPTCDDSSGVDRCDGCTGVDENDYREILDYKLRNHTNDMFCCCRSAEGYRGSY